MTLDVATRNEVGKRVWQRLGFTEWAQRLSVPVETLDRRITGAERGRVVRVPSRADGRLGRRAGRSWPGTCRASAAPASPGSPSRGTAGSPSTTSCSTATARRASGSPPSSRTRPRRSFARSPSRTARSCATRSSSAGSIVDEYQSVPEFWGPLPPGDVVALGANPTVVSRLTGAEPARVRAVARTASSPDELPPARRALRPTGRAARPRGRGARVGSGSCPRSTPPSAARMPHARASSSPRRGSTTTPSRSTSTTGRPGSTRRTRSAAFRSTRRTAASSCRSPR